MSFPIRLPSDKPLLTVTHPTPSLWIIELHNGTDNRLTTAFITSAIIPALDAVERDWRNSWRAAAQTSKDEQGGKGALIIVGNRGQHKFFSNGLDYENAVKNPFFFPNVFNPMLYRLFTFPIPTVAAINGHCFAGGMMLSLSCDYRVMTDGSTRNAWMCMNEVSLRVGFTSSGQNINFTIYLKVHFGASWPLPFGLIARAKVTDATILRKIALEGHRFTPKEAVQWGLIDHIASGDTEGVLSKAQEVAEAVGGQAKAGAYGLIRSGLHTDVLEALQKELPRSSVALDDAYAKARL
ncbi:hypothetical protein EW026_g6383 [Hermanssonia centrifuga]|uniref:ClpP/crotonase n=1 Tax=Hermanssonia centrifuga TaxID=98765 RepID=A0A4S4KB65_9APHY|nr:hypothetical protein EW026_g6383 [Hermanssonia centrifuga]